MRLHSLIGNVCLVGSIASLAVVYGVSDYWLVLVALPALLLFGLLARRSVAPWGASALLCMYVGLAVAAVLLKLALVPIELGCLAALIWWDLQDFGSVLSGPVSAETTRCLERYRLQSLAITVGASLLLAGIGFWLRIQLPFGVIALLILLITGSLVHAVGILRNPPLSRE